MLVSYYAKRQCASHPDGYGTLLSRVRNVSVERSASTEASAASWSEHGRPSGPGTQMNNNAYGAAANHVVSRACQTTAGICTCNAGNPNDSCTRGTHLVLGRHSPSATPLRSKAPSLQVTDVWDRVIAIVRSAEDTLSETPMEKYGRSSVLTRLASDVVSVCAEIGESQQQT